MNLLLQIWPAHFSPGGEYTLGKFLLGENARDVVHFSLAEMCTGWIPSDASDFPHIKLEFKMSPSLFPFYLTPALL
jgi:hypothetical protein